MKRFRVDILGKGLDVGSDATEEEVFEIARYVDEKMSQAVEAGRSTSRENAAVLAALNIAEEFFREKKNFDRTINEVEKRSERLIEEIGRGTAPDPW